MPGEVAVADVLDKASRLAAGLQPESADLVLTNPPFLEEGQARISPDQGRAAAHALPAGGLEAWLKACTGLLKPKGRLVLIHRADRVSECLQILGHGLGGIEIRFVHPDADRPAIRVLLSGVKGSRAPLTILPPRGPERPRRALHASGRGAAPGRGDSPMKKGASRRPLFSLIAVAGSADRAADLDRTAHPAVAVPGPPGLDPAAARRADGAITPVGTSIIGTSVIGAPVLDAHDRGGAAIAVFGRRATIAIARDNRAGQRPAAPRGRRSQGPQNQEDRRRAYAFFLSSPPPMGRIDPAS